MTGASSRIGYELAREYAEHGFDLLINAEDGHLAEAADRLRGAQVARQGFEALMAGKDKITAGSLKTRAQAAANKVLPDSAKAELHRGMAEHGSGDD
ncbi:hypothetical protein ACFV1W_37870 [Kitasatospora sp. NPDC059648]|uniref:hypothetical protein n=1 Tax=Kitasatospora sp. NPDC059648 TaxID=3346894 RepID=UPI0036C2782F